MRGDEGFINFNIAESSDEENEKIRFAGVFYLVGKNGNGWKIKHKREVADNILADSGKLDDYFPKAANGLKDSVGGDYWGFVESNEKLKKSCKTSDCGVASGQIQPINRKLSFNKGDGSTKKLGE